MFIFKVIIAIPVLWFSIIGFMVVMSGGGIGVPDSHDSPHFAGIIRRNIESHDGNDAEHGADHNVNVHHIQQQPVIEIPNEHVNDRLRFNEAMDQDIPDMLRRNEEANHNHPKMIVKDPDSDREQVIEPEVRVKTTTVNPNAPGTV